MQRSHEASLGLENAFPARLRGDVRQVIELVPYARLGPTAPFDVVVGGETLTLPYRIYNAEPDPAAVRSLTGRQRLIAHCLYSRHHDGRVRQRRLESLLDAAEPWVVPFVVQLAGEYVLEIVEDIGRGLSGLAVPGSVERRLYGEFITRNPAFYARTEARAVSYWDCYHRGRYPVFGRYPGSEPLEAFRSAATEHHGARWPRNTPSPFAPAMPRRRRGRTHGPDQVCPSTPPRLADSF
ncbi:hypothetical protein [Glycomyces paridis]|uniref:hypothetical protein n=1 Tax=Glycomyces paridis TaxID=2126555 RepID=UPI00195C159A|nr:hypothetical protein [Glycomyces paridis]